MSRCFDTALASRRNFSNSWWHETLSVAFFYWFFSALEGKTKLSAHSVDVYYFTICEKLDRVSRGQGRYLISNVCGANSNYFIF